LRAAHDHGDAATDDAALVELHGGCAVVVPGDVENFKVTAPHDLDVAAAILAARGGAA
jgi:2-C-methyl-D-erythritol 4-phosphate cytidylyltransferase